MTVQIALTLGILGAALLLLVFDLLRSDLIALLVLLSLAFTGLVTPNEALSGFSNQAVITVWAMFIMGAGLARTGVANLLGRSILRLSGKGEASFTATLMLIVASMAAFMNSTAIVAMFLPVISYIARKRNYSPSKLLLPLSFGTLLGGINTVISTPPNILVNNAAQESLGQGFQFFDFLKAGLPVTLAGIAFMVLIGRHLLPKRDLSTELNRLNREPGRLFDLEERLFTLKLPQGSVLAGKRLGESRLGSALKLNVVEISRKGKITPAPGPDTLLDDGDELLVLGRSDWLEDLVTGQHLVLKTENDLRSEKIKLDIKKLVSSQISLMEVTVPADSPLIGQSLYQV